MYVENPMDFTDYTSFVISFENKKGGGMKSTFANKRYFKKCVLMENYASSIVYSSGLSGSSPVHCL